MAARAALPQDDLVERWSTLADDASRTACLGTILQRVQSDPAHWASLKDGLVDGAFLTQVLEHTGGGQYQEALGLFLLHLVERLQAHPPAGSCVRTPRTVAMLIMQMHRMGGRSTHPRVREGSWWRARGTGRERGRDLFVPSAGFLQQGVREPGRVLGPRGARSAVPIRAPQRSVFAATANTFSLPSCSPWQVQHTVGAPRASVYMCKRFCPTLHRRASWPIAILRCSTGTTLRSTVPCHRPPPPPCCATRASVHRTPS